MRSVAWALVLLTAAACGGGEQAVPARGRPIDAEASRALPARSAAVARARRVGRLRCTNRPRAWRAAHVELFVDGRAVLLPAGIGLAPPLRRVGARRLRGRCSYALRTREPTGVIELDPAVAPTLGDLFALWGQPLSATRLAGWRGRLRVAVAGRRVSGDPRRVRLAPHAQVVLQIGRPRVVPNASYRFPPGL